MEYIFEDILNEVCNEVFYRLNEYCNGNDSVWDMEEEDYSFTEVEFDSGMFDYVSGEWLVEYLDMFAKKHFQFGSDIQFTLTNEDTILIEI